ncbi:MAG TPA: putative ABC exporter domain-containing protein [Thermoanaerobaculia bacterium]|nr:putative ABC exporter domain-containing protein [Thermoanaerobaculia bacterium]
MIVARAFVELAVRSFRNRIVSRVKRMKDPRYAVGALFGLLYFGWIFFRNRAGSARFFGAAGPASELRLDAVSAVVLFIMLFAWALPGDSGGLEFSEAEIAFLFPAPLRRRDLLLYKIIRQQPQVLMSVLVFTFFGATRSKFIGLWIAFSVMSIYMMLVALGRARLRLMGINFLVRLIAVLAIAFGIAAVAFFAVKGTRLDLVHVTRDVRMARIDTIFHIPAIAAILFLPKLYAGAVFPPSLLTLATSSLALLLIGALFFVIADRLNVSFEEGSLVRAQRRNERLQQMRERRGGRYVMFKRARAPFRLAPTGRPETAIVWKNTVATVRMSLAWIIIIVIVFAVLVVNAAFMSPVARSAVGVTFLMLTCLMPFIGPNIFTNDLRLDLPRLEVLKSYPLSGEGIVAAEVAAPLVIIAALELTTIGCAWAILATSASKMTEIVGAEFAVVALLLAVPVVALQLLIRNAVPIIFPAWAVRTKEDPRGFVITGQRLLLVLGNLVVLGLALVPAALVFAPSAYIAIKFFHGNAIFMAVMTAPAIVVICGEVWLGVRFLGSRFEALDVSQEFDTIAV